MGFLDFLKGDSTGEIIFTDSGGEDFSAEELAKMAPLKIKEDSREESNATEVKKELKKELVFDEAKKNPTVLEKSEDSKELTIKNIKEIAGLGEKQLNTFYEKMNTKGYKVQELLENILSILSAEEKEGKSVEELVRVFKKQVSGDNLARIVVAFIILVERDEVENVLVKKKKMVGNLGKELEEMGISVG
ncbi:MAG: hypothetical protein ACWGHO_03900 [Candidatus Moraniibacteriota bacterium]